jgi:hypothetical protein
MAARTWWLSGFGGIGIAVVILLLIIAYALLTGNGDGSEAEVAGLNLTATATPIATATHAATPTPTPPPPTPEPTPVPTQEPPPTAPIVQEPPPPPPETEGSLLPGQERIAKLCSAVRARTELGEITFGIFDAIGLDSGFLKDSLVEMASDLRQCDDMGLGFDPIPSADLTAACAQADQWRSSITLGLALVDQVTAIRLGTELNRLEGLLAKWCGSS